MTSQEYWAQREAEQLKHNLTEEEEITARIEKMYRQTLREVQTEIEAFYARYASSEGLTLAEARKKVSELDMKDYEAKAEKYVRLKDMSPQANAEMKLYNATMRINRLEMLKAEIGLALTENTAELEELLGESLTERTLAEFERQAGILGATIKDNAKLVKSIVNASYQNGTFSERLWGSQVTLRSSLESLLVTGLVQGKNARELAPKLEKTFGSSKYAAERLLRTELARVQTDAQMESFKEGGYDQYMFITVGAAACPVCTALNGKVFNVKDMAPGENAPPMHPNCRCSTAAYMDREKIFSEPKKEDLKAGNDGIINYAKAIDSMFSISENGKTAYSKQEIVDEMSKSKIGQQVLDWIENSNVKIAIYEDEYADGQRGDQRGDCIRIFPRNIPSLRVYAQTVIHEMGHYHYNIGQCQHAEAICFGLEKLHITGNEKLTLEEWNYVKKLAIDNYTNLEWEAGGYGDYSKIRLYD